MTDRVFTVSTSSQPGGPAVLRVSGELDHHTAPQLSEAVHAVPSTAGIVLDLTGLSYCDSTGITVFVTAHQRAEAAGGSLDLAGLSPDLTRVFGIVGLDQVLSLHPTVEQALRSAHARRGA
ncbi:STAS domain-containing protein [Saccharothrix sp. Mg75]|uniref:STAS domain-containing protein n=1 Tax=Saccharothrix sp. Mg75 TaxID=3445357 RepID=UPI003EE89C81